MKQARLLREGERRMERQETEELEQRSREMDKFAKWKADEDQFHLGQTLLSGSGSRTAGSSRQVHRCRERGGRCGDA